MRNFHTIFLLNKRTTSRAIYAHSQIFEEKKLIGIPYSPVKWTAKVDRILFILVILYKSLHGVLGQKGS